MLCYNLPRQHIFLHWTNNTDTFSKHDKRQFIANVSTCTLLFWICVTIGWLSVYCKNNYVNMVFRNQSVTRISLIFFCIPTSAQNDIGGLVNFRPNVYHDGTVSYNFPSVIKSLCKVDVTYFPFDTQICKSSARVFVLIFNSV